MFDVIVVGARCAGSPTAMLLAQKGHKVLCVDKATFPGDTICSHYIHPPGVMRLKAWGLLEEVRRSNCPPVRTVSLDVGPFRLKGQPQTVDGVAEACCVRRATLDQVLLSAAAASGVEVREGFTLQELLIEDGTVAGIRGSTRQGTRVTERSRIVVGADGMRSAVARLVRAKEYKVVEPLTCIYYSYWSGVPVDGLEVVARPNVFVSAAPTNDGLTILSVVKPRGEFRSFRSDIKAGFTDALDLAPELAERVRGGKRVEPFSGTADTTNFFRYPYGPGWALVGDAGYHRDAITAQGISDAFRDAEILAAALDSALAGRRPLEKALADYHSQRDCFVAPMYEFSCDFARLEPPLLAHDGLFQALRGNQADTDQFLGTIAGTVSINEFYSPENFRRILRGQ